MNQFAGRAALVFLVAFALFYFMEGKVSFVSFAQDVLKSVPSPHQKQGDEFFVKVEPGNKKKDSSTTVSKEQKDFFKKVTKEIDFCAEQELKKKIRRCPHDRKDRAGKALPSKDCAKQKKAESQLECEKRMLGRIPYRQRPAWAEYRGDKTEREKKILQETKGSKKGATTSGDSGWLTEF